MGHLNRLFQASKTGNDRRLPAELRNRHTQVRITLVVRALANAAAKYNTLMRDYEMDLRQLSDVGHRSISRLIFLGDDFAVSRSCSDSAKITEKQQKSREFGVPKLASNPVFAPASADLDATMAL